MPRPVGAARLAPETARELRGATNLVPHLFQEMNFEAIGRAYYGAFKHIGKHLKAFGWAFPEAFKSI